MNDITVVIPSIPPRAARLERAVASVLNQTYGASTISIPIDYERQGAAINRQRGLDTVTTEYVAFLDDDDYFKPNHLEALMDSMVAEDADYVYSWYDVQGGGDPRPEVFGQPWSNDSPVQTTITTLVKTELARSVGGFVAEEEEDLRSPDRLYCGEDWRFTKRILDSGAKIVHRPEKTWVWCHWGSGVPGQGGNTSGLPNRW